MRQVHFTTFVTTLSNRRTAVELANRRVVRRFCRFCVLHINQCFLLIATRGTNEWGNLVQELD